MPSQGREVRRSARFVAKAQGLYPPGGSPDGRPSFELFERLICEVSNPSSPLQFDDLPVALQEVPSIRHVMTHAVPYFPALVIYGILLMTGLSNSWTLKWTRPTGTLIANDPDD